MSDSWFSDGEELSSRAIELIEENLRLRSLLLSSVSHKESPSLGSGDESQKVGTSEELEDGAATTGKEESEREDPPAPSSSSSSSQADRESTGEKENEDVQAEETRETVSNASKEDGARGSATTEQLWPISSLLSDESRAGPREHNLPILSPTYIAEHCSTSSCETHFFPPSVSSPPIASVSSSVGTSTSAPLCSHVPPATETLSVISTGSIPSTTSRPVPCTSSVSHATLYPPHPTPPYPSPTTSQSIVQPWIGSPTSRNDNATIHSSVTVQQSQPLQATVRETGRQPVHHVQLHGYQHSVTSMVHCTNHQEHMYTPRPTHSVRARGGLHAHTPQYTSTGEHYTADDSTPARIYSSHTHRDLTRGRGHCSENLSSYFSTGPTFQLCAGSVNPAVLLQTPSFSNVSTDHYFHHSVQPMHNLPSLQSHHQLHTQHNLHSHPSSHNIGHHPHPHPHNYPVPPHPHHPTLSFTPHPHHPPSHHGTVWRPYSDRQRTATRFSLSNILSPSLTSSPPLGLATPISPSVHQSQGGRIPSFFVDHLLDDL